MQVELSHKLGDTGFEVQMELIPQEQPSGVVPYKQGYNTPQFVVESVSKACFGVYTRDSH